MHEPYGRIYNDKLDRQFSHAFSEISRFLKPFLFCGHILASAFVSVTIAHKVLTNVMWKYAGDVDQLKPYPKELGKTQLIRLIKKKGDLIRIVSSCNDIQIVNTKTLMSFEELAV